MKPNVSPSQTNRFSRPWWVVLTFCVALTAGVAFARDPASSIPGAQRDDQFETVVLQRLAQKFEGDLAQIRKRRVLRVLVSYSKTNFFLDKGVGRGYEHEMLQGYEKYINRGQDSNYARVKLVFIPLPFDRLLPALRDGYGDIAAAGLTITPERTAMVRFTSPYLPSVSEVVVTHKDVATIKGLEELAGRTVTVRAGSSYVTHLRALNRRLTQAGGAPVVIHEAEGILGTEDILELVNAGVIPVTVVDHHIAELWAEVLPAIVVHRDLSVHSGGQIAWAVRKSAPKLLGHVNAFMAKNKKGSLLGNMLFRRYYEKTKWIKNPISAGERRKLDQFIALFRRYADRYGFDWLAIAAQAYQESGLNPNKRSPQGAMGIMQVLPSTAADKSVQITKIHKLENNIHAGVKYLDYLRNTYFNDSDIPEADQVDFSWAAYNAGPAKINRLRAKAAKRGFDANRWFGNVEKIAAETIGRETVTYVANINKYYIAYKLLYEGQQERDRALAAIDPSMQPSPATAASKPPPAPMRFYKRKVALKAQTLRPSNPVGEITPAAAAEGNAVDAPRKSYKKKVSLKALTRRSRALYHTVKPGETLYSIARRYKVSVGEIVRLNRLQGQATLHPGDRLVIRR